MQQSHTISISKENLSILRQHAISVKKYESCALLLGEKNHIKKVLLTENSDSIPEKFFTIPSDQLIRGYKMAETQGYEVIGIFHSHPSSKAIPSNTDIKYMSINPVVWMIYSGTDNEFRAYVIKENSTNELENVHIIREKSIE